MVKCQRCSTRARYGREVCKPTHCFRHKLPGMTYNYRVCGCGRYARYGTRQWYPVACSACKTEGMHDVVSAKCRLCNTIASFGLPKRKPTACSQHRTSAMINRKVRFCSTCRTVAANPKYKPLCARCFAYTYPDDPRVLRLRSKEHAFMEAVQDVYPNVVRDRIIQGGCSRRRPDGMIDCNTHTVLIEIDEDQHRSYDDVCENKRVMEIFRDLGSRPLVVIRLNPDGYMLEGKRAQGAFNLTKVTKEIKKNETVFSHRLDQLLKEIQCAVSSVPVREVSYIELFFDAHP